MTSFASLMAISATQTRESQQLAQSKLEERNRKIAEQKRLQEAKEAKEREQEKKLRMQRFEEERRQKELAAKKEQEREARELAMQRREKSDRDVLRYGPKKAAKLSASGSGSTDGGSKWPTSTSGAKEAVRKHRLPDEDDEPTGIVLTREELRERKHQAEMRKVFATSKRSSHSTPAYRKHGMRLPGGAVNIVKSAADAQSTEPSSSGRSVKDRLTNQPNTLTLLNTKKKDKRTEDEILEEVRARRKVISGTDALAFNDWFGDSKKKEVPQKSPVPVPTSTPPAAVDPPAFRTAKSMPPAISSYMTSSSIQRNGNIVPRSATTKPISSAAHKPLAPDSRGSSRDMDSSSSQTKLSKTNKTAASHRPSAMSTSHSQRHREIRPKRPRSPSLSESPTPPKKRAQTHNDDLKSEIWKIFGKDRGAYTSRDVYSDDEDMEADATALEREEKISARIAKKEEMLALEEERQHEEEKRQRKKERERALARGH